MTGQQLTELMGREADKRSNRLIARLLSEGAEWIPDPQVDGVYGLRPARPLPGDEVTSGPARVVVIAYLNGPHPDFEISESFDRASYAQKGARR